ncbi:MAG: phage holin family protein [Candidatus Paceibacterota bacterium]|jgi:putative membrane protein
MKFITNWLIYTIAIIISAYLIPGVALPGGIVAALVLAIVLGVINTFIKPIVHLLALPMTLVTLGVFALIINALLIMLAAYFVPGVVVTSFWAALIFSVVLALINAFLSKLAK